ncbi:MAG: hypothetical protein GF329_12150, partial [Candidatus Lokiarchaeota archaeon]|nr:hypothetical protein [Candidatus Lokiarchaeota archaeon]
MRYNSNNNHAGYFGKWFIDKYGLPAYEYNLDHLIDPIAKTPTTGKLSVDHFHQLGNDRFNIIAYNSGNIEIFNGDRGFQWLSYLNPSKDCLGGGILFISENNNMWLDLFTNDISETNQFRRIFGSGYFKKIVKKQGLIIKHTITPVFGDKPLILSDIEIKNELNNTRNIKIGCYYGIRIKSLVGSLLSTLYMTKERKNFGNKIVSLIGRLLKILILFIGKGGEQIREKFASKFYYKTEKLEKYKTLILTPTYKSKIKIKSDSISDRNYFPKSVFLTDLSNIANLRYYNQIKISKSSENIYKVNRNYAQTPSVGSCLFLEKALRLKPNETVKLKFLFGYMKKKKIEEKINEIRNNGNFRNKKHQLKKWRESLIDFNLKGFDWLDREVKWHTYYLLSSFLYDEYFKSHYITQGNAYTYLHGLNGAIRDFILFNYSLIFINPEKAKEFLIYMLRTMKQNGELPYAINGFGQIEGAMVHETSSDLGLFLLWGLLDYIYLTRDFGFLDEEITFYPKGANKKSTVYERIILTLKFLIKNIGFGEHKLLRVGSGDWSDGISMFVSNRKKFLEKGESVFNSAFFLYLIPRLLPLIKIKDISIKNQLEKISTDLKDACNKCWNKKWFYRAWDGTGNPVGDKNIFLEHHPWIILSNKFSREKIEILIKNIYNILDKPSRIGQFVCYPPNKTLLNIIQYGVAENGGIWFAMNFLLTWAYSIIDKNKAFKSLLKNSMANRAKFYPNIWYGIWSGSDSYNAEYTKSPGQTFIHPLTPQVDFPIMNMNIHANFLNSILKLSGIKASLNEIIIDPKYPDEFQLQTSLFNINYKKSGILINLNFIRPNQTKFVVKLLQNFVDSA